MVLYQCPRCGTDLTIGDDKVGKLAICPSCKNLAVVPESGQPAGKVSRELTSGADVPTAFQAQRAPRGPRSALATETPTPYPVEAKSHPPFSPPLSAPTPAPADTTPPLPPTPAPEASESAGKRRRVRIGKVKQRIKGERVKPEERFYPYVLGGAALLAILLSGLALVVSAAAMVTAVGGVLLTLGGWLWLLAVAFRVDRNEGWICLLVPPYVVVFLSSSFQKAWRPLLVVLLGALTAAIGTTQFIVAQRPPGHARLDFRRPFSQDDDTRLSRYSRRHPAAQRRSSSARHESRYSAGRAIGPADDPTRRRADGRVTDELRSRSRTDLD